MTSTAQRPAVRMAAAIGNRAMGRVLARSLLGDLHAAQAEVLVAMSNATSDALSSELANEFGRLQAEIDAETVRVAADEAQGDAGDRWSDDLAKDMEGVSDEPTPKRPAVDEDEDDETGREIEPDVVAEESNPGEQKEEEDDDGGLSFLDVAEQAADVLGSGLDAAEEAAGYAADAAQAALEGNTDKLHTVLDVAGFVFPGADIANAALYAWEGDYENAAWSAGSAVSGYGDAAAAARLANARKAKGVPGAGGNVDPTPTPTPKPTPKRVAPKDIASLPTKAQRKAAIDALVKADANGLTLLTNHIKSMGQGGGATLEIVQAKTRHGETIYVAALNSRATWHAAQKAELEALDIPIAPQTVKAMKEGLPHAEENLGAYLQSVKAKPTRWSRGVVGDIDKVSKYGAKGYVCKDCRSLIKLMGGVIEPAW